MFQINSVTISVDEYNSLMDLRRTIGSDKVIEVNKSTGITTYKTENVFLSEITKKYNDEVYRNAQLTLKIQMLNMDISTLNNKISELESTIINLKKSSFLDWLLSKK